MQAEKCFKTFTFLLFDKPLTLVCRAFMVLWVSLKHFHTVARTEFIQSFILIIGAPSFSESWEGLSQSQQSFGEGGVDCGQFNGPLQSHRWRQKQITIHTGELGIFLQSKP